MDLKSLFQTFIVELWPIWLALSCSLGCFLTMEIIFMHRAATKILYFDEKIDEIATARREFMTQMNNLYNGLANRLDKIEKGCHNISIFNVIEVIDRMRIIKLIVSMILVLVLFNCTHAPMVWNKPGVNTEDFRADNYECIQQSRVSWYGGGGGLIGIAIMVGSQANAQDQAQKLYNLCMEVRGYSGHVRIK